MSGLQRPLHHALTGVVLLTLSLVTPAASVYVIIPGIIQQAGTGAFLSLAAAAVVGLAMAFVYCELGAAHPIAGGEYALFGRTLGPLVGFAYMGMNAIGGALALLYANWIDPAVGRPSLIATGVIMAGAVIYCAAMRARRGPDWVVVGPADGGAEQP